MLSWRRGPWWETSRFHHSGKSLWWGRWHKPPSFSPGCRVWCTSCTLTHIQSASREELLKAHCASSVSHWQYLQSTLLRAAYFSGLKSFAVITTEKWVILKGRGEKNKTHLHVTHMNEKLFVLRAWRHVDRDLRCNTVPCLVRWVPGPQLLWCSTKFDRTDRTQRCESRGRPGSGSTFWAEPASGPSSRRGSTTPTACLRSHLSLRRPHSCSDIYPKPATKLYWTVMDVMPCRLAWHGHNGVMWHPLSPRRRVRLNYHEHEERKRTEDAITLTD